MHHMKQPRTRLALGIAIGLGFVGGLVLTAVDSPGAWYFLMGVAVTAIGTVQALRPGAGIPMPGGGRPGAIRSSGPPRASDAPADVGSERPDGAVGPSTPAHDVGSHRARFTVFIAYAADDRLLVERFLGLMRPRCSALREMELELSDQPLGPGPDRERVASRTPRPASFGLLCVTPAFLASRYATEGELPELFDRESAIAVGLQAIDPANTDLRGLDDRQIFRYRRPGDAKHKSFADCSAPSDARFCDALVAQLIDRLAEDADRQAAGSRHRNATSPGAR